MTQALGNATQFAGKLRVFQTLPRHMRRRAASYNIKRLPCRVRKRAIEQNARDAVPQRKINRKRKRQSKASMIKEYATRQGCGRWLSTHIWHAKRFKMESLWGYKIPMHPNTKSTRASFKASIHQSILFDTSYYCLVQVQGTMKEIELVFKDLTDPLDLPITHERYLHGSRYGCATLYPMKSYPCNPIGPIHFIWKSTSSSSSTSSGMVMDGDRVGTCWIWIHPGILESTLSLLESSKSYLALETFSWQQIHDFSRFSLVGPRSHAILQHVLDCRVTGTACTDEFNKESHKIWEKLKNLSSPSSLPSGIILGLSIRDPRLTFPLKMPKRQVYPDFDSSILSQEWSHSLANSLVWDWEKIKSLSRVPQGIINKRRSESLVPGMSLDPQEDDSVIPILLIQRKTLYSIGSSSNASNELLCGWDIVIPNQFAMDLWRSLTFSGCRVGGLKDLRALYHESGLGFFPHDYPETSCGRSIWQSVLDEQRIKHDAKPMNKKCNYKKLGLDPFSDSLWKDINPNKDSFISLRGPRMIRTLSTFLNSNSVSLTDYLLKEFPNLTKNDDYESGLVRIFITMMDKGSPEDYDYIYTGSPMDISQSCLSESCTLVGYVTSGNYSLKQGKGTGMAICRFKDLYQSFKTFKRESQKHWNVVLIRNRDSLILRPALYVLSI